MWAFLPFTKEVPVSRMCIMIKGYKPDASHSSSGEKQATSRTEAFFPIIRCSNIHARRLFEIFIVDRKCPFLLDAAIRARKTSIDLLQYPN